MSWEYTPFTPLLVLSAVLSLALAGYVLLGVDREGRERVVVGLAGMLLGAAWWSTTTLVRVSQTTVDAMVLGEQFEQVGAAAIVLSWFVFTLAYTDRTEWLTRRTAGTVAAVLAVGPLLALTNGRHGLLWTDPLLVDAGSFTTLEVTYQPVYFAHTAASYLVILAGIYALLRLVVDSQRLYRGQAAALIVSAAVPTLVNLQATLELGPWTTVDLSPVAFTVSGGALAFAIGRYRLLDLDPVARRRVVRNMRDGYVVLDDADRVVDLNPAAARLLDVSTEGAIGTDLASLVPELADLLGDDGGAAGAELVFEPEPRRFVQAQLSTLDGEGDERDDARGRLLLLHDVTDRREVEARYQTLIENASDVVFVLDAEGTVTYVSPAVEHVLGVVADDVVGTNAFAYLHPDDRSRLRTELDRALEYEDDIRRFEFRLQDADGNWCTLEGIGRNLLDDPAVEGLVVNARDITDRKERERELERQNERLEQFASVVSHDLRNPLEVARGHLELAREGHTDSLEKVADAHDRMETIVENVLTLAREGQQVETTDPVPLDAIARTAWESVETDGGTLRVEASPTVAADRERLCRLLENLVRNAVEHGTVDEGTDGADGPTVRVGSLADGHGFYVADDGPGLPEDAADLFRYGYTTSDEGTGFGLAIVESIAEAHGWEVRATDADDGGARFEFVGVERA